MAEEMITMVDILSNIVWAVALIEAVLAAILLYLGYKGLTNKPQKTEIKYFGCEGKGQYQLYRKPPEIVKYHCPNCGNTYFEGPNNDTCIICGQEKSVKIKE